MKFRLVWVLALMLLTACGEKSSTTGQERSFEAELSEIKDAGVVEKRCASVKAELLLSISEAVTIGRKYPAFMIQGNVTDTSEGSLQIFGRAFVDPAKGLTHWASSGNERNIIVIHPKNAIHNPSYYVGEHYFIKKDSGKNGFGADVPVWVFGDPPEELALAIQVRKLQQLKLSMCNERLRALNLPSAIETTPPATATTSPKSVTSPTPTSAPSFDCTKASIYAEREVCASQLLGQLDTALNNNIQHLLAADIGDGARSDLRQQQRGWLGERNKCTSTECITGAYRARMDAVCEIPVLSGMHPVCTSSDDIR